MHEGRKCVMSAAMLCVGLSAALAADPSEAGGANRISGSAGSWPAKAERDAAARAMDVGESAPDWLVESETYAFDYWTHSGRWTTEYELGASFGKFSITFDGPGKHSIEIVDVVPADMKTPAGYGTGERLGQFMDPSQPTKPSGGKKFRFREWAGPARSAEKKIEFDVQQSATLSARFDVEHPK